MAHAIRILLLPTWLHTRTYNIYAYDIEGVPRCGFTYNIDRRLGPYTYRLKCSDKTQTERFLSRYSYILLILKEKTSRYVWKKDLHIRE